MTFYSNLTESTRLSRTIFEISLIFQTLKRSPRPFQGYSVVLRLGLAMINMYTKFEVSNSSLSRSRGATSITACNACTACNAYRVTGMAAYS